MGRHTLHLDAEAKVSHYVCDYTGIPMKGPGCFMPFWKTPTSRMTKRGNFCCWEAVLQHARATADQDILPKIESYVAEETHHMIGPLHLTASDLTYLGGKVLMEHWLDAMWTPAKDVPAMLVKQDGRVLPVTVMCIDGRYKFQYWINACLAHSNDDNPWTVHPYDVCYCSVDGKEIAVHTSPHAKVVNPTATSMAGHHVCGDAVFARYVRETALYDRIRYVPIYALPTHQTYADLLATLVAQLSSFEKASSASAEAPREAAKGAKMPRVSGKALAELAKVVGHQALSRAPSERLAKLEERLTRALAKD